MNPFFIKKARCEGILTTSKRDTIFNFKKKPHMLKNYIESDHYSCTDWHHSYRVLLLWVGNTSQLGSHEHVSSCQLLPLLIFACLLVNTTMHMILLEKASETGRGGSASKGLKNLGSILQHLHKKPDVTMCLSSHNWRSGDRRRISRACSTAPLAEVVKSRFSESH